jgi:hypothetical protein
MLRKKGFIEFGWIFALIVGAIILFLAFYFIGTKLMEQKTATGLITENTLDILLNPFSYFGGLGASATKEISLQKKEIINISCEYDGGFGYDTIKESSVVKPKPVYDKYIFSENLEGKNFQVISKPLTMPWRIADLIYVVPKNKEYCFVNLQEIEDEFGSQGSQNTGMNISNFKFVSSKGECSTGSIIVCSGSGCDSNNINIVSDGYVLKQGQKFYFSGKALMYAAIFSSYENYNCNLKRLAKRAQFEAEIYRNKVFSLNLRDCNVMFSLDQINPATEQILQNNFQGGLIAWKDAADIIDNQNGGVCKLY